VNKILTKQNQQQNCGKREEKQRVRQQGPEEHWEERESRKRRIAKGEKWLRRGRRRVQRRRRLRKLA